MILPIANEPRAAWVASAHGQFAQQFKYGTLTPACGDGWLPIYLDLIRAVDAALTAEELASFSWRDLKEKYGELRAEFTSAPEIDHRIERLVDAAAARAAETCITCGRPGQMTSWGGWLAVVCADHKPPSAREVKPRSN